MKKYNVGGQAVIEGVMMRGLKGVAVAVRDSDGIIHTRLENKEPISKKYKILNLPILRGFIALIDSLKTGMDSLNYSSSFFSDDEEKSKFDKWLNDKFGKHTESIITGFTMILSFLIAILLFAFIPTAIASFFKSLVSSYIALNLIEAFFRIAILILYMVFISKMSDIFRLLQYHGAEHKTIFCYEKELPLTVENVKIQKRFHPRCGTNFLFLVMFVSIIIFTFTGWGSIIERMILRIVLIPLITGISYEIIRWLGKNDNTLSKIIASPGLKLQILTTREPDDSQIEVAIESLKTAEGIKDETIGDLLKRGNLILEKKDIDTSKLDSELLLGNVLNKERVFLITHKEEKVTDEQSKKYYDLINLRSKKMPVKYILKKCDFMGIDFYIEEGVLIPRSDTEILVDRVLKNIKEEDKKSVCDLCCGSGAIGIALAYYRKNINVDFVDYYHIPEKVTKINIKNYNLEDRTNFIRSNLLDKLIDSEKKYDIIVSNPPYIEKDEINNLMDDVKKYEPLTALDGGTDGLKFYREISKQSINILNFSGILAFEIGYNQGENVKNIMEHSGYKNIKIIKDLAGLDRVVIGEKID
ncbi:peptide chain release factor N(5)-glutamine methyltransferase [Clostridium sp. BJN0001]|uniref:peptide chain release factor N(5)-glutamine methyltransferase n=1 Tax=Clostridium sp. BJN0001 TaxID=2930219 RepID=UPI001FD3429A|nr:peptide chain release factor N(5)-glutamine methyltransferase [Clostridium sp. BJN0001]